MTDAERYRWLREHRVSIDADYYMSVYPDSEAAVSSKEWENGIDKAMKEPHDPSPR